MADIAAFCGSAAGSSPPPFQMFIHPDGHRRCGCDWVKGVRFWHPFLPHPSCRFLFAILAAIRRRSLVAA
jgi:hypothetical protein